MQTFLLALTLSRFSFLSNSHVFNLSVIFDHSWVKRLLFVKNRGVSLAHLAKINVTFDNKGKASTVTSVAIGNSEDYKIFSIDGNIITADTYRFVYSAILIERTSLTLL